MKNDLISRSELKADLLKRSFYPVIVKCAMEAAPAVDAVEVVRCKKCDWYREEDESCSFWPDKGYRDPNHFCGEGKRRCENEQ